MHIRIASAAEMSGRNLVARLSQGHGIEGHETTCIRRDDLFAPETPAPSDGMVFRLVADTASRGSGTRTLDDQPGVILTLPTLYPARPRPTPLRFIKNELEIRR